MLGTPGQSVREPLGRAAKSWLGGVQHPLPPSRRPHSSSFLEATHWLPVFPFLLPALELVFTLSLK